MLSTWFIPYYVQLRIVLPEMDGFLFQIISLWKSCSFVVDNFSKSAYEKLCSKKQIWAYFTRGWIGSGKSQLSSF